MGKGGWISETISSPYKEVLPVFRLFKKDEMTAPVFNQTPAERLEAAVATVQESQKNLQLVEEQLNFFIKTHGLVHDDYGDIEIAITSWNKEITEEFKGLKQRCSEAMGEFQSSLTFYAEAKQLCLEN